MSSGMAIKRTSLLACLFDIAPDFFLKQLVFRFDLELFFNFIQRKLANPYQAAKRFLEKRRSISHGSIHNHFDRAFLQGWNQKVLTESLTRITSVPAGSARRVGREFPSDIDLSDLGHLHSISEESLILHSINVPCSGMR